MNERSLFTVRRAEAFFASNATVFSCSSAASLRALPADVLSGFEEMLLPACKTEAFNPLTVPKGEIREVVKTDANGLKVRHFIGQDSFVKFMGRPGRRVVSFRTDQGYVDASGRGLR